MAPHLTDSRMFEMWWHAQKPDFVFRRNGRVHLNRQGASAQSSTGSRGVRISGSNAGYSMFRGSVKSTGYPLHPPVSPSIHLPCVTLCHHISTGLYHIAWLTAGGGTEHGGASVCSRTSFCWNIVLCPNFSSHCISGNIRNRKRLAYGEGDLRLCKKYRSSKLLQTVSSNRHI
jgi:hypothetical protein